MAPGHVAEAFRLAFPKGATERVIVALTAYFDESGTHPASPAVAIAGYVAADRRWQDFETEWRKSLRVYGISAFHMTDFVAGRREFAGWRREVKHPRLRKLIGITNSHVIATVGCAFDLALYRRVCRPRRENELVSAYNIAALTCLIQVGDALDQARLNEPVAYVFEQGAEGAPFLQDIFRRLPPDVREQCRGQSMRLEDKRQFVPLQAADIAAWAMQNELPKQLGLNEYPKRTDMLNMLHRAKIVEWSHIDERMMRAIAAGIASKRLRPES